MLSLIDCTFSFPRQSLWSLGWGGRATRQWASKQVSQLLAFAGGWGDAGYGIRDAQYTLFHACRLGQGLQGCRWPLSRCCLHQTCQQFCRHRQLAAAWIKVAIVALLVSDFPSPSAIRAHPLAAAWAQAAAAALLVSHFPNRSANLAYNPVLACVQVAAAALLERLLEGGTVDAQSLLDPNAGEKAPKKWEVGGYPWVVLEWTASLSSI